MPRADGPFKILEKINDNAYKLELPAGFGVSPTFNIADLKPYLGEEDELESRTTQMQEGEDDEDISSIDTATPAAQQGPMTRARARQLNYQVQSFLTVCANSPQNWMLLNHCNDCLILRNIGTSSSDSDLGQPRSTSSDINLGQPRSTSSDFNLGPRVRTAKQH